MTVSYCLHFVTPPPICIYCPKNRVAQLCPQALSLSYTVYMLGSFESSIITLHYALSNVAPVTKALSHLSGCRPDRGQVQAIYIFALSRRPRHLCFYLGSYRSTAKEIPASKIPVSVACALPGICASTSRLPTKSHIHSSNVFFNQARLSPLRLLLSPHRQEDCGGNWLTGRQYTIQGLLTVEVNGR
jgi:hypothetical protein